MPSGVCSLSRRVLERAISQIGAALHVVDAGSVGDIALDAERQPLDETHRVHGVEMAEHQDARLVLPPGRAHDQVIAAAVLAGNALDLGRQSAVAVGDERNELVDLFRSLSRALDFNPALDAF